MVVSGANGDEPLEVDDGLTLPVNMLFVDSRGEAMRVLVESDGLPKFMN
jgi:hypothetical protein